MKKTAKSVLIMLVMAVMLVALTGCGNKLVATRTVDEEDSLFGKYEETVEITFKNKKADKITTSMEFEDEDTAKSIKELYDSYSEDDSIKVEQKGKKISITMDVKDFIGDEDVDDDDLSKESLKEMLEEEGYKVK